jgi:hypothetical protein
VIEQSGICREIRPWSASNGLLVNDNEPLGTLKTFDVARYRFNPGVELVASAVITRGMLAQSIGDRFDQELADQARFTGSGNAGDAGEDF